MTRSRMPITGFYHPLPTSRRTRRHVESSPYQDVDLIDIDRSEHETDFAMGEVLDDNEIALKTTLKLPVV